MKNLQFLKNCKENFAIFSIFLNIYRIFGENLDKNLEICICKGFGSGAEPPNQKNQWIEKSMETCNYLIVLMKILPFFNFLKNFIEFFAKIALIISENMEICICRWYSKIQWKPAIFWKISWILREFFI